MFRRLFMLAAVAGVVMVVARKVGIIGSGDDEPIEYVPEHEADHEAGSAHDGEQHSSEE